MIPTPAVPRRDIGLVDVGFKIALIAVAKHDHPLSRPHKVRFLFRLRSLNLKRPLTIESELGLVLTASTRFTGNPSYTKVS